MERAARNKDTTMTEDAMNAPMPMPPTLNNLLPYLTVDGTQKAAEFYKTAFGAELAFAVPPDEKGRTMHMHLYINGSSLMLSDAYPEYGHPYQPPQGIMLQLIVEDIDVWWDRAVKAGAEVVTPVEMMFWGARWGQVKDPFGVLWGFNEVTP
jgi:PhnB protein